MGGATWWASYCQHEHDCVDDSAEGVLHRCLDEHMFPGSRRHGIAESSDRDIPR